MQLSKILTLSALSLCASHATGFEQQQTPLSIVKPQTSQESTIVNFDDLRTNLGTSLGASNSFTYNNLTFKSFLVASIPITLTRPYQPWNVNEVFCLGSAPNVIVGSRSNASNLWPTISTCSLSDNHKENECNGTFNLVSLRVRPMGNLLGPADGVRLTFLTFNLLRLSEWGTQDYQEMLSHPIVLDDLEPDSESESDLPPNVGFPGFPNFGGIKTFYQLLLGLFRPGPAPSLKVEMKHFRTGFGTKIDTIQIYGYTYPLPGGRVEPVDWPFCIDDLELEFNPEEEEEGKAGEAGGMGEGKGNGIWREELYF